MSSSTIEDWSGTSVLLIPHDGPTLSTIADATDMIGDAMYAQVDWVVLPADRLSDDFFHLRTRMAGEVTQKYVNYRLRLAIVGDIDAHLEASNALRDFARECNRGRQIWFMPDLATMRTKLAETAA
ncbi:MAG TPA: DUF4180 domain-containing protein [Candidatus Stackebrandtia faecavium]|nr:DUF4180 domain-containing protein [Candidatus Stackebrandtia faecavium]